MRRAFRSLPLLSLLILPLAACDETGTFTLGDTFKPKPSSTASTGDTVETIERDVEAPEIFEANEPGLWDGRPSLGGVWVAHPDVKEPERVLIRNTSNDAFVVGALFRRERDIPGPRLQISSDAAEALGILAGAPAPLSVVALRKEIVAVDPAPEETELAAPEEVETATLDPLAGAAEALADAPPTPAAAPQAPAPTPKPRASALTKPFIQIGIFSVEANANRTAQQMRGAGLLPTIKPGSRDGKPFWRVLVGPATNSSERAILLKQVQEQGFADAYVVTN